MRLKKSKVAAKGIEPIVSIGVISAIVIGLCRRNGVELDESQAQLIAGSIITVAYGAFRALRNWWKNR